MQPEKRGCAIQPVSLRPAADPAAGPCFKARARATTHPIHPSLPQNVGEKERDDSLCRAASFLSFVASSRFFVSLRSVCPYPFSRRPCPPWMGAGPSLPAALLKAEG